MYILQCGDYESIISWSGNAVIVKNIQLFVETVLPTFFKQSKFDSFTRNLRRWGFSTRRGLLTKGLFWSFSHPGFNKAGGFAECSRIVTSGSKKAVHLHHKSADSPYGVSSTANGRSLNHHYEMFPPSRNILHSQTGQIIDERQHTMGDFMTLAHRREMQRDHLINRNAPGNPLFMRSVGRGEQITSNIPRPVSNATTSSLPYRANDNLISCNSYPYEGRPNAHSIYRGAREQTMYSNRDQITTSSPTHIHAPSFLDLVTNNNEARLHRRQLVLERLSSFCQNEYHSAQEKAMLVQMVLNQVPF